MRLSLFMWGLAAAFYLIDFFQRVSPAALALDLSREIAPTAVALGSLSSAYFITYAGCQLPAGLLMDRFGTRRLLTVACLIGLVGALRFATASDATEAVTGRLILGASGAVAWVGMLKLASHWFSPARFAGVTGLSLAVGGCGAVLSGLPLSLLASAFGWREVLLGSAGVAGLMAAVIFWKLRDEPKDMGYANYAHPRPAAAEQGFRPPWRDLIYLGLGQMGVTGAMASLAWLWNVPYLTSQFQLEPASATLLSSMMMVFFAAGGLLFGAYSDRHKSRKRPMVWGTLGTALGLALLASGLPSSSLPLTIALLWLIGGSAGSMVLSFAFGKDLVHGQRTATIVALVNLCVMTGSIGLPPLFGAVLDHFWAGDLVNGVRHYSGDAYQWAFGLLSVWVALTLLAQLRVREA